MRIGNFALIAGSKSTAAIESTLPTSNLIASGVVGSTAISSLDILPGGMFISFATQVGDDTDNDPIGNIRLYNVSHTNTSVELSVTQSFSANITGSAETDFILFVQKKNKG